MKKILDIFFRNYFLELMDNKLKENLKNDLFNLMFYCDKCVNYNFKEILFDYKNHRVTIHFDLNGDHYTYVMV